MTTPTDGSDQDAQMGMRREGELFEQFHFQAKGMDYLKLCLDVTVYWVGSLSVHAEGILDFYQQSMELLRDDLRFYLTETMEEAEPIREETFELLPLWLNTPDRRDIYILRLESSSTPHASSDRAFEFRTLEFQDPPRGALRLIIALASIGDSAFSFVELARKLVRKLDFSSGHCGFAINWNKLGRFRTEAKRKVPFIAARFPGVDLGDTSAALYAIPNGIKRVNWLTLLNQSYCERLGGIDALRALLDETPMTVLERGVLIQAGARPFLGDRNRRETLPHYHHVGRILAPLRSSTHPAFIRGEGMAPSMELTEQWLAWFDR